LAGDFPFFALAAFFAFLLAFFIAFNLFSSFAARNSGFYWLLNLKLVKLQIILLF